MKWCRRQPGEIWAGPTRHWKKRRSGCGRWNFSSTGRDDRREQACTSEVVEPREQAEIGFGYQELARALQGGYAAGGFQGARREWVSRWEALVRKGEPGDPELPAYLYGLLGERDRAFAWMEKAMEIPSSGPPAFKTDPSVDALGSAIRNPAPPCCCALVAIGR